MIRVQCPKCDKKLGVKESQAGKLGLCPGCQCKFRIPAAPAADEFTDSPPGPSAPRRQAEGPPPGVRKRRYADDEDLSPEDDEAERLPLRKRKKKRRKRGSPLLAGLDGFTIALIGLGVAALFLGGLALIWPPLSIVPVVLGWLVSAAGGVWFLVVAFQDDAVAGLLCLLVPFYSLYYLITHFEEVKRPFFIQVAGTILLMAGFCAGVISA